MNSVIFFLEVRVIMIHYELENHHLLLSLDSIVSECAGLWYRYVAFITYVFSGWK